MNDLVDVQIRRQQPFEDMQPLDDLIQAVLQTPAHGGRAIGQPFGQQITQILDLRRAVQANDVDIGAYVLFQPGGGEQMRHHGLGIHAVAARHDYETCGVFMIGLIAQIRDHRQFLGCHLRGDLFQHLGTGGLIRQRIDHHFAGFDPIGRTHLDLAVAGGIQPAQLGGRRDDFGPGGEIRSRHMAHQGVEIGLRVLKQMDCCRGHLAQVVRRDIGGHAHGNARAAVQEHVGQARRQRGRLVQRAVEVGLPIDRALAQLGQQRGGIAGQARFGIAHGRKRFRVIGRAPVALPIDQRIAISEGLGHDHHGLVAGRIAVRMELADHIPDRTGGFLGLGGR